MSDAVRQRIVASAARLFAERGYSDTSLAEVAAAAGVLKGNLAYYFKNKAELLTAVTAARHQQLAATLAPASGTARLAAFLAMVEGSAAELARYGCPIGSLCSELAKDERPLLPLAAHSLGCLRQWLSEALANDQNNGDIKAEQLLARMQGAALLAHSFNDPQIVIRQVAEARQWLGLDGACG